MAGNNNGFGNGVMIYVALALIAWMLWPTIKQLAGPDATPYGSGYQQPAGRRGPPNNHSGVTPWDPFGLRNRIFGMRLDPGEVSSNVEDRRGEYGGGGLGPIAGAGQGIGCWDTLAQRPVPVELCDAEHGGPR